MKLRNLLSILVLAIAVFATYLPAIQGGFIWDDDNLLLNNPTVTEENGITDAWLLPGVRSQYYPLVYTSFHLEHRLWGFDPMGYHLVNVGLHLMVSLLLWRVLLLLGVPGAFFAACLFALHPVCVESVAWISERKNVLSGVMYLSSAYFMLSYFGLGKKKRQDSRSVYALGLFFFLLALFSKTVTASLPAALLVVLWFQSGKIKKDQVLALIPFFILGLALGLFTVWMERHEVWSGRMDLNWSLGTRLLLAGRALWFYLSKIFWPFDFCFVYPRWDMEGAGPAWMIYPLAAVGALALLFAFRRRIGRGPLAAALFFGGTLFPALGFFDVFPFIYSLVADHFQYLAAMGPIALFAAFSVHFSKKPSLKKPGLVLVFSLLAFLGFQTWTLAHQYQNMETLWVRTLAQNPQAWMAHNNLGALYLSQGKLELAEKHLLRSNAINPRVRGFSNLGLLYLRKNNPEQARISLGKALQFNPHDPPTLFHLALLYENQNQPEQAKALLLACLRQTPDTVRTLLSLGRLAEKQGQAKVAQAWYGRALEKDPNLADAHDRLGLLAVKDQDFNTAQKHFLAAASNRPQDFRLWKNLGAAYLRLQHFDRSIEALETAVSLAPDDAPARGMLVEALWQNNDREAAAKQMEYLHRLAPRHAAALEAFIKAEHPQPPR